MTLREVRLHGVLILLRRPFLRLRRADCSESIGELPDGCDSGSRKTCSFKIGPKRVPRDALSLCPPTALSFLIGKQGLEQPLAFSVEPFLDGLIGKIEGQGWLANHQQFDQQWVRRPCEKTRFKHLYLGCVSCMSCTRAADEDMARPEILVAFLKRVYPVPPTRRFYEDDEHLNAVDRHPDGRPDGTLLADIGAECSFKVRRVDGRLPREVSRFCSQDHIRTSSCIELGPLGMAISEAQDLLRDAEPAVWRTEVQADLPLQPVGLAFRVCCQDVPDKSLEVS